ncbi:transcription factor isoform X3 [Pelobates cultripes]|uniref:Transcription factor isoform X3 n=1 Tax=Pelobates cultripes TaxID=61616 RepID=A0AAD1T403_PELCU|nr:transcription factor isoform X3 [Pelobates cultripes]
MREVGRTDSHDIPGEDGTTLDDVMDLIHSESQPDNQLHSPVLVSRNTEHASILETVTVASCIQPRDCRPSAWQPLQDLPLPPPPPQLLITEQPKQRGMRFRYQCEGRSAGSILGQHSTDQNKTLPAIELRNCENISEVCVRACLVWKDHPHRVHPHGLVGKDCHDGICEVTLHPKEGETQHSFSNLGIQCVRKKEIETAVQQRLGLGIDPYHAGMWRHHEEVDLNVVRLCFQASYYEPGGQRRLIPPVLSEPVYDKKSTNTSELKICRMNKDYGHCEGGEEVYILCDKVQKEDIQVVFGDEEWEARADFAQADVHRQIAIVLKTPPYRDLHIMDPVTVSVYLQRITDGIRSEGVNFTYKPRIQDLYGLHNKKRRYSPQDDINDPDPHCIEAKRNRPIPDFMDHCIPEQGTEFCAPYAVNHYQEYWPGYSATFEEDNIGQSLVEEVGLSTQPPLPDYNFQDPTILPQFEEITSTFDGVETADLFGSSLALTEQGQEFPDYSFERVG